MSGFGHRILSIHFVHDDGGVRSKVQWDNGRVFLVRSPQSAGASHAPGPAECGAKHFTSWLTLAPHNKISGGRLLQRAANLGLVLVNRETGELLEGAVS